MSRSRVCSISIALVIGALVPQNASAGNPVNLNPPTPQAAVTSGPDPNSVAVRPGEDIGARLDGLCGTLQHAAASIAALGAARAAAQTNADSAKKAVDAAKAAKDKEAAENRLKEAKNALQAALDDENTAQRAASAEAVLCKRSWKPLAGKRDLPRAVVDAHATVDVCGQLVNLGLSSVSDDAVAVYNWCKAGSARSLSFGGIGSVALNATQGFGGFLTDRAQEEIIDYAVSRLGDDVCKDKPASGLAWHDIFSETCAVLFPNGNFNLEAATTGKLRDALIKDLRKLPALLLKQLPTPNVTKGPNLTAWRAIIDDTVAGVEGVVDGKKPIELFANIDQLVAADNRITLTCDAASSKFEFPCHALVAVVFGAEAAKEFSSTPTPDVGHWIETSATTFCGRYGASHQQNPTCFIDANYLATWHDKLVAFAQAFTPLARLQASIDRTLASGSFPAEATKRALPDLAAAVGAVSEAYVETAIVQPAIDADTKDAIAKGFEVGVAVLGGDWPTFDAKMRAFLGTKAVKDKGIVPAEVSQGATFLLDLSQAKSRDDAKQIIADAAAPLGSYKVKYGRVHGWTVTLNGFVGPFAGAQANFKRGEGANSWDYAFRMQAPVGLDIEPPCLSGKLFHGGLSAIAIDPLALTVTSDKGATAQAEWASALTPGAYARIGLFASPVVLMGGFTYQPALKSSETCAGQPCWVGALQYGVSLSADVPVLILH